VGFKGLALYLLTLLLSGCRLPFHAVMPVPYNALGRIKGIWIFDSRTLKKLGIRGGEGWFDTNSVWAWVVKYGTVDGDDGSSCFIVRRLEFDEYPYSAMVCSPEDSEKLLKACKEVGKPSYGSKDGGKAAKEDRHEEEDSLGNDEEEDVEGYINFDEGEYYVGDWDKEGEGGEDEGE